MDIPWLSFHCLKLGNADSSLPRKQALKLFICVCLSTISCRCSTAAKAELFGAIRLNKNTIGQEKTLMQVTDKFAPLSVIYLAFLNFQERTRRLHDTHPTSSESAPKWQRQRAEGRKFRFAKKIQSDCNAKHWHDHRSRIICPLRKWASKILLSSWELSDLSYHAAQKFWNMLWLPHASSMRHRAYEGKRDFALVRPLDPVLCTTPCHFHHFSVLWKT